MTEASRAQSLIVRSGDFRRLWMGQSVSVVGDHVALFAVPSLAILVLHASSFQVGLLNTATQACTPVVALFAGAIIDHVRRKHVLICTNLALALAFASIAIAASIDELSFAFLFVASVVAGTCAVIYDIAYQAYLPSVISYGDLAEGNSFLEVSNSGARLAGPALGGLLMQALGATGAVAANSLSFVAALYGVLGVRRKEPPAAARRRGDVLHGIADGLTIVFGHPLLRPLTLAAASRNVGNTMARTVLLLFAYRALELSPGALGAVLSCGAVASIGGALGARALVRRLGLGRTLALSIGMEGAGWMLSPLAMLWQPALVLAGVVALTGPWLAIWNSQVVTVRQVLIPTESQGRVHAAARSVNWGASPLGALTGGLAATGCVHAVGSEGGLGVAMVLSGAVALSSALWILASQVMHLRDMPAGSPSPHGGNS